MARQPQLYFDHNATAPLRGEAIAAMQAAMGPPSNPSSVHAFGRDARMVVETARSEVAMLAGCRAADVVFTSGGTEANNLVLSAFDRIITCAVEHDSVLQAAPRATVIGVDGEGRIDLDSLQRAVEAVPDAERERTLVSVMSANNETGVLQPIEEVAESPAMPGWQRIATWSSYWASGISISVRWAWITQACRRTRSAVRPA